MKLLNFSVNNNNKKESIRSSFRVNIKQVDHFKTSYSDGV